jgi:hypothetical protein
MPSPNAEQQEKGPSRQERLEARRNSSLNSQYLDKLLSQVAAYSLSKVNPTPVNGLRTNSGAVKMTPDGLPDPPAPFSQPDGSPGSNDGSSTGPTGRNPRP